MDDGGQEAAGVPPARDPEFARRYLARDGLTLGAAPMPVPDGFEEMPAGPQLGVVLAGLDPRRLHRGQLADVISAHGRMAAFEFAGLLESLWEWARSPVVDGGTVVRTDAPYRFAARELAPLTGWTAYRAEQMLVLARLAVHTAPRLCAALRAGRLDRDRLEAIAAGLKAVTDEELIRRVVDELLGDIGAHTTATLADRIRTVLARLDPAAVRRKRERDLAARTVRRREAPGGLMKLVVGCVDAAAAVAAFDNVDAIARATQACGDPLDRSMDQLRTDIALDLLRGLSPAAAGHVERGERQGTITLTVGLSTLAGLDEDCAHLAGYGPITAAVARQTAAQFADTSTWRFALHDEGDATLLAEGRLPRAAVAELVRHLRAWAAGAGMWLGAGDMPRHPVDHTAGPDGRAHRDPTAAQKAFVRARDRTCRYPGCRVPARRCEIDHRIAWIDGGPTIVTNLAAVCKYHHTAKHSPGFDYQPAIGGVVWSTPGRRRYLKLRERPGGLGRRQPVTIDLTGYTHASGPPPRLRH